MKKLILYAILFFPIIAFSDNPPPPGFPPPPVHINSLVNILLAAGIVYGAYIIGKMKYK